MIPTIGVCDVLDFLLCSVVYYIDLSVFFFFFNVPATTEIYTYCHTLTLHDALPIYAAPDRPPAIRRGAAVASDRKRERHPRPASRRAGHRPAPAAAHARDPGGGTRAMNQQADISREGDFYVPAFEVRVRGRRLHRTVINDVISLEYTDDLKAIAQSSMTINNWNAETRSFKYSDADLFLPKAEIEINIGYLPTALHPVLMGNITDMQVSFPAAGQSVLTVSGLNKLDEQIGS